MDLPEVQDSARLEAAVPLGDAESLERLRERAEDTVTRPAGSTALVDADIPPGSPAGTSHGLAAGNPPGDRRPVRGPGNRQDRLRQDGAATTGTPGCTRRGFPSAVG